MIDMKKICSIIMMVYLSVTGIYAGTLEEIRNILNKYDGSRYNTAQVLRTVHNTAISDDIKEVGTLYIQNADIISLVFRTQYDAMLYDNGLFTMYQKGKKRVAGGTISEQLGLIFDVMDHIKLFNDVAPLEQKARISVSESDNIHKITIEPIAKGKKNRRRLLYTSCEIEFDVTRQNLKSLKLCRCGGNYTLYTFRNFEKKTVLPDHVFKF